MVRLNRGLETKGDYIKLFSSKTPSVTVGTSPLKTVVPADVEFDVDYDMIEVGVLPIRAPEGYELKEKRTYMFAGAGQLAFQLSGLMEINRLLMSEVPVAATPLEKAAVGDSYVEIPGMGRVPVPNTRMGMFVWARYIMGLQGAEVQRSRTAAAEEPNRDLPTTPGKR